MTIEIGLAGDAWNRPIGNASEFQPLFDFVKQYELIDRLYRRYVRDDDVIATKELIIQLFDEISLDAKLRRRFIAAYDECTPSEEDRRKMQTIDPIRIVNVTAPIYVLYGSVESLIPLEDYDNLEGDPFWMRPEYVFEHY